MAGMFQKYEGIKELYDMTLNDAVSGVIDDVSKRYGVSKKDARTLVTNALIYNVVTSEIVGQCGFLLGLDMSNY